MMYLYRTICFSLPKIILFALLAFVLHACGGGSDSTPKNQAPTVTVRIVDDNDGRTILGDSLTASYVYTDVEDDPQGATSYRWLRNGAVIDGANALNYTVVSADINQTITFEVTPVAESGTLMGTATISLGLTVINQIVNDAPTATDVSITDNNGGDPVLNDELTGSYAYTDAQGDEEGVTTFRWLRNDVAITGADLITYTVIAADVGQSIVFEVTPVANMGATTVGASDSSLPLLIKSGGIPDTSAPKVIIEFPPSQSLTEDTSVTIHGLASDVNAITSIRINGNDVISNDNYLTWSVVLPLGLGLNTLTVETSDNLGNTDTSAAIMQITAVAPADLANTNFPNTNNAFKAAKGLALDSANKRILVTDSSLRAVLAVDLSTGVRSVLASGAGLSATNTSSLFGVQAITVDKVNKRALVTDVAIGRVVSIDLGSGVQTLFTNDGETFNMFQLPNNIALDSKNNRALVAETSAAQITAANLDSGARTTLSSGNSLKNPGGIAIDYANNRALVIEGSTSKVIAVDLDPGGAQTVLPFVINTTTTSSAIAIDTNNNQALLLENGIIAMELSTGIKTEISNTNKPGRLNYFRPVDIIMSESNNRALLLSAKAIMAVYLPTGERVIISK